MAAESSTRTTRLSGDLDDRYIEYRDQNDMTDAEALRHLIRTGLEEEEKDPLDKFEEQHDRQYPDRPDGLISGSLYDMKQIRSTAVLISGVFLLGFSSIASPLSYALLAISVGYAVTAFFGFFVAPALDWLGVTSIGETAADSPEVEA